MGVQRHHHHHHDYVQVNGDGKAPRMLNCGDGLEASEGNMKFQMLKFSRTLDKKYFDNATQIFGALKSDGFKGKLPRVSTWAEYDKSFTWPKIRQYEIVQEGMETLEHFEDDLNLNISNTRLMNHFLSNALAVRSSFATKFHDGEFADPASAKDPKGFGNNK